MKICFLFLLAGLGLLSVEATHLVVGQLTGDLVKTETIQYNPFPFMKRVKMYFYTQPDNRKIQGIQMLDNLHSKSSVNITAGGVGYPYVNLRMKSERGGGLDYSLGIYVEPYRY